MVVSNDAAELFYPGCLGSILGYLMSVIVEAGILHQNRDWPAAANASYEVKKHVDPIHVSIHFLYEIVLV